MRWTKKLSEKIKHGLRSWLNIAPAGSYALQINEMMDFEMAAIRNKIWYSADGNKIEQMSLQINEQADRYKFWSSRCSQGMEMRKIHTGLPSLMVRTIVNIIKSGLDQIDVNNPSQRAVWEEIEKENDFRRLFEKALKDVLVVGDGAFKISADTDISKNPIIEWYSGEKVEFVYRRGRLREVVFKTEYRKENGSRYILNEHYGYGYITSRLYREDQEVPLTYLEETAGIVPVSFDESMMLAVPLMIYENASFECRGGSIYDSKLDAFDAFDEVWSQWMDAVRAGRANTYIPDCLLPRDPDTGALIRPNPFDNRYFATDGDMSEGAKNTIYTEQPSIPHESYVAAYSTALDLCLQGVLSPSTLGIDVKKLDNSEAQREKEKTTLYTRDAIIDSLQIAIPKLVETSVNTYRLMRDETPESVSCNIKFTEYANPSFESQVETVGKARTQGIMSVEMAVDELYGDTIDDQSKEEEVKRLKKEQGIEELEEPAVRLSAGQFQANIEDQV